MKKSKAFTLIELLVVVAIIGILMAVLVPALRVAKEKATGAVCLSNQKSMAAAWHAYAMDQNEELVPGHIPLDNDRDGIAGLDYLTRTWWVEPPQNEAGDYRGSDALVTLEFEQIGIRRGALFHYQDNVDVYHCPGNKSKNRFYDSAYPNKPFFNSYSITGMMNGEDIFNTAREAYVAKKMNDIRNPGGKVVFIENVDRRGWVMGSWLMNPLIPGIASPSWVDPLGVWHRDRGTIGYADGHAEMQVWVDESTIENAEAGYVVNGTPKTGESRDDINFMSRNYVP